MSAEYELHRLIAVTDMDSSHLEWSMFGFTVPWRQHWRPLGTGQVEYAEHDVCEHFHLP
jgi:hypothetical protein